MQDNPDDEIRQEIGDQNIWPHIPGEDIPAYQYLFRRAPHGKATEPFEREFEDQPQGAHMN